MAKKPESRSAAEKDMERQIGELREEIVALTKSLDKVGAEKLRNVRHRMKSLLDGARGHGEGTISEAQQKLHDVQEEVSGNIREKPLASVAIAAGIGFILAHMLRR